MRNKGLTVLLTGLSSSGKTTLANAVANELCKHGRSVEIVDGDTMRASFSKDLGFTRQDREENLRRMGYLAEVLTRHGVVVLIAAIAPFRDARAELRRKLDHLVEVYVYAPLAICEERDTLGVYRRARAGVLHHIAGLDDPYEPLETPEVECPYSPGNRRRKRGQNPHGDPCTPVGRIELAEGQARLIKLTSRPRSLLSTRSGRSTGSPAAGNLQTSGALHPDESPR